MSRGTGRGTIFTRIQKVKRTGDTVLPICSVCRNCKDKTICNNREHCNKCLKCKNCNNPTDCDKFYFYKRTVGEFKNKDNKIKPIYNNKKTEINKELSLKIAEIHQGKYIDTSDITLAELMEKVVENRKKVGITKGRAYLRNKNTLKAASNMPILQMKIQEITHNDLINSFELIRNYSESIIDKIFGLVNSAFKLAIADKIMYFNPLDNKDAVQKPKSRKKTKKVRAFTIDEQKLFYKATYNEDNYGRAFRINLSTGLRPGELLALQPNDYNKETNELHISRTLTRNENDNVIIGDTTKTYSGDRFIPVTNEFKQDLIDAINNIIPNENNLIFTHKNGTIINPVNYNSAFKRVCNNIGITDVSAYVMRHSFATRRIEAHMDIKLLAELMGHKNTDIIYKNYVTIQSHFKNYEQKRYERYMETVGLKESNVDETYSFDKIITYIKSEYINNKEALIEKFFK